MMILKILLLFFVCCICCGNELLLEFNGNVYQTGNTHAFDLSKFSKMPENLLISTRRDLFLASVKSTVKSTVNFFSPSKNPSNLQINDKITLKSDGNFLTGSILKIGKYFIETNLHVKRGDSGKTVFDGKNMPIGLISHYKKDNRAVIVRIDNLSKNEFEKITPAQLQTDLQFFNEQKEYEYYLLECLKKSSSSDQFKKMLKQHKMPPYHSKWHSAYLQHEYMKSRNICKKFDR